MAILGLVVVVLGVAVIAAVVVAVLRIAATNGMLAKRALIAERNFSTVQGRLIQMRSEDFTQIGLELDLLINDIAKMERE